MGSSLHNDNVRRDEVVDWKVLLVDDEPEFLDLMQRLLSKDSRFAVVGRAGSAEEALELVPSLEPDVVVMDVNMPGMGGLKGASRLRKLLPEIAIVVVSDTRERQYAASAKSVGAIAFIAKKKLSAESLLAAVEA